MQMSEEEIHNFAEEARLTRNILRDDPDDNINTSGHNQDNIQGNIDSTEEQNQDSIDSTQEQNQDGIDSTVEQNQDGIDSTQEQNQDGIDSTVEQNQGNIDSTEEQNQDSIDSTVEQNQDSIDSTVEQNQDGIDSNIVSAVEQNQGNNVSTEVQNEAVSPPPANLLSYFKKILTRVREFKRSCTQLSLSTDLLWRLACIIVSILSLVIGFTAWEKNDSGTWSKFFCIFGAVSTLVTVYYFGPYCYERRARIWNMLRFQRDDNNLRNAIVAGRARGAGT
ncbi:hypothetical protein B5S30_g5677 [[Candida] boidinii]|nr:hypothetical protein B5S30_g5677 [[Candida] boidinii]